jgi:hypothetical protein
MPRSVADIDSFITMLRVACEDTKIHAQLERILEMPDEGRRRFVDAWVRDMLVAGAPKDFIQAIGCLLDDRVAEKAYEVIFHCRRGDAR